MVDTVADTAVVIQMVGILVHQVVGPADIAQVEDTIRADGVQVVAGIS